MTSETTEKRKQRNNTPVVMGLPRIVIMCAIVNIVGGLLFGYAIGFVAIYTTYTDMNTNCTNLVTQEACSTVEHAKCSWNNSMVATQKSGSSHKVSYVHEGKCLYTDGSDCPSLKDKGSCTQFDSCAWNARSNECNHVPYWSATETGIFAGAMIVGGMVGSLVASKMITVLGVKRVILICGILCLLASVLFTIGQAANSYGLLVVSRMIIGAGAGISCVACPLYVGEMTPDQYQGPVGVLFQVACTFGIFLASLIGIAMQPPSNKDGHFTENTHMQVRFQMLVLVQWICSALFIPLSFIIPTPKSELGETDEAEPDEDSNMVKKGSKLSKSGSALNANGDGAEPEVEFKDLIAPLIGSIALCAAQQLTGINAVMNYAPQITKSAGLAPLTGNFIIMFWNFVTTLVSIPLAKRFPPRRLFLVGTAVASTACGLTGLAVYPGIITAATAKHVLAGLGIIVFIAAFEMGMGPTFWIHAQALFPGKYRQPGCSFTLVFQFVLNIFINVFFPISLVALSGGPSGNPDKGMGIVFFAFGGFGALALAVMMKTLHPAAGSAKTVEE